MKTIFVFAYYSYQDPVFQSAVLPYLRLVKSDHLRFVLLTWEQEQFQIEKGEKKLIQQELQKDHILWHSSTWHSGRFKMLKKAYDFINGLSKSLYLIYKYRASKIFSEGFPGAIFGHYLSKITFKKHIIHTFEPHADYMVDAGVWSKKSWEYRLLKKLEKPVAKHAYKIITATPEYAKIIESMSKKPNVISIPSCIDFSNFKFKEPERDRIRTDLNISKDQIVIVYLGKIGGMYMEDELFGFFKSCLEVDHETFYFFLFTKTDEDFLNSKLKEFKIPPEKLFIKFLRKEEVSNFLSAADVGFCGVRPIPSQQFSSPIKTGEYWASGLFTLLPKYVSNDWKLLNEDCGLVFEKLDNTLAEKIVRQNLQRPFIERRLSIQRQMVRYRDIKLYKDSLKTFFC